MAYERTPQLRDAAQMYRRAYACAHCTTNPRSVYGGGVGAYRGVMHTVVWQSRENGLHSQDIEVWVILDHAHTYCVLHT
jgi:hypothetical protein